MKKTFILGLSALILASCGLSEEEKTKQWLLENINTNHLEAYLKNNGREDLSIFKGIYKEDTVSVVTNDMFIINELNKQGKFTGAENAFDKLNTVFSSANISPEMILYDEECNALINIITEASKIEFVYFLVYTSRNEKNGLSFMPFPFVDEYTSKNLYYDKLAVDLINTFSKKVNEGNIFQADTLAPSISEQEFLGDGISAELIASLTMNPNKSITKKETKKGRDKTTGEYYTADVDVQYSGKEKSWSKIRDYFLDVNSNIYVVEDVEYIRNYDFSDRFPNGIHNIKRIRIRKFDAEGVQEWSYCGLPCSTDSIFSSYGDLSFLSMGLLKDTLNIFVYEGNHSFSIYNSKGLNESEVIKHVLKINPSNGELHSFNTITNEVYQEYKNKVSEEPKNKEKLNIIEHKNILDEPYHTFKIGEYGEGYFYSPFDSSDCDCVID